MTQKKFEIVIENKTGSENKSPIAGSDGQTKNTTNSGNAGSGFSVGNAVRGGAAGLIAITSHIKPFADYIVSRKVSTVALRTGSQELEEQLSHKVQIGQRVSGIAMSALAGAAAGGPVGAFFGFIVGGISSLVSMGMERAAAQEKLDIERTIESIGLQHANNRAGGSVAAFSGSRMRNQ